MSREIDDEIWSKLRCPYCESLVERVSAGARCVRCTTTYAYNDRGQLDMRLQREKRFSYEGMISHASTFDRRLKSIATCAAPSPQVGFSSTRVPVHLDGPLLSHFPKAAEGSWALDLGCGSGIHREVCEEAGFRYLGVDLESESADVLADAQALPFRDAAFDFVISIAVMQYVQHPIAMVQEIRRVLVDGGSFIGSAAFLEPYDGTFYHLTHKATLSLLENGGFEGEYLAPDRRWHFLTANAWMLFPKLPIAVAHLLISPLLAMHRLWWWLGKHMSSDERASEEFRLLATTGAIRFVANASPSHDLAGDRNFVER